MRIVVLVKQVPRGDSISVDPDTKRLRREGVPLELNEPDRHAVAEAVRLGGEVVAVTMGPPQAAEALEECLALGVSRCVHLSDRVFAVADSIGTSRALALAVGRLEPDLVLCGHKALDAETRQVPPETAAFLGLPHLTHVVALEWRDGALIAVRESDDGDDTYEIDLPAVISVGRSTAPRTQGPMDAGLIETWTGSDLVDDVEPDDRRFGQTGSPTRVLAARDVTPERADESAPSPDAAAARIAALLAERARTPSSWEKPERLGDRPGRNYDCWSVVETRGGRATRCGLELLGKSRELAGKLGGQNVALVLGHEVEAAAREVARHGAERVVAVDDPALDRYEPEAWAAALRQVLRRERPHAVLLPASAAGRDYGPRVAGELGLGMTADCVDLGIDRAGRLIQFKPAYGGNIVSVIMGATTPQLATVRPRMFEPVEPRDVEVAVEHIPFEPPSSPRVRFGETRERTSAWQLDEAEVVVCVGAGVDPGEVEELVGPLGAAVGGDRESAVHPSRRLGLLGRQVAPRLYLSIDAIDDFEHLTASVKAGVIASIGSRPHAADVRLDGDWRELLPALVDGLRGRV